MARTPGHLTTLNARQDNFVRLYLEGRTGVGAVREAGYSDRNPRARAYALLHESPAVMAAIEAGRKKLAAKHEITLDKLVDDVRADPDFAYKSKNATAAVRATELLAKITGFMIDRKDIRAVGGFQLVIAGIGDD